MHFFRMRLILALVVGITLVSVASTYFEVLAHKHVLRRELERRTAVLTESLLAPVGQALDEGKTSAIASTLTRLQARHETLGLAVYNPEGRLLAGAGPQDLLDAALPFPLYKAIHRGSPIALYTHDSNREWLESAVPLMSEGQLGGNLIVFEDAGFIRAEGNAVWRQSFWRIVGFVVLIVGVTVLTVRWFLMRPMDRVAERLRRLRMGHSANEDENLAELSLFSPIVREVETMAESLVEARANAQTEARLRDAGEHTWTAERLAAHVSQRFGSSRIFAVSNREPYIHIRKGRETVCEVPPSGLVTAIEPVLCACDGVWVAHGSGNEDANNVDSFDRLRVPPESARYTLRRVWLSAEEESAYYDGFANEGLWPLCHIAHTRPIFRASDWEAYQRVNQRFAAALLQEMESSVDPIVFVQDYHFALVPRLVKAARPDARVAIFWHIPWPNQEAFGICPWQAELLDGLLGADLIGFHIPLHCNNFLATVDRVLESRTDREHMTVRRHGHLTAVRPYPVSVSTDASRNRAGGRSLQPWMVQADARAELFAEFGVTGESLALGVDRLDYTKGIIERLMAIEVLLEQHPWHLERLTMVQIAAPSRTRIPSYIDLSRRVEETAARINQRFQTARWKPIVLIKRQCSHQEVDRWYRAADVCLVTSLHDGMNLVAKEYLMARDDEDGALVLSKFTGAAVELTDALQVNPYDTEGVAEAIHRALEMGPSERHERMSRMRRHVMEHNVYRWAASILGDLRDLRMDAGDASEVSRAGPVAVPQPQRVHRKLAS